MTMHINLSPEMEGFIKGKVTNGFYGNATEVIRDAIRRMQSEEIRLAAWQLAIRQGDEQLDRGEEIAYLSQTRDTIKKLAIAAMHGGKPLDPDVLP